MLLHPVDRSQTLIRRGMARPQHDFALCQWAHAPHPSAEIFTYVEPYSVAPDIPGRKRGSQESVALCSQSSAQQPIAKTEL